jgi:hypothetical protein
MNLETIIKRLVSDNRLDDLYIIDNSSFFDLLAGQLKLLVVSKSTGQTAPLVVNLRRLFDATR